MNGKDGVSCCVSGISPDKFVFRGAVDKLDVKGGMKFCQVCHGEGIDSRYCICHQNLVSYKQNVQSPNSQTNTRNRSPIFDLMLQHFIRCIR